MQNANKKEYEDNLARRQKDHLDKVRKSSGVNWKPCLHDQCQKCHGTGITAFGYSCVHGISCDCPKCSTHC